MRTPMPLMPLFRRCCAAPDFFTLPFQNPTIVRNMLLILQTPAL